MTAYYKKIYYAFLALPPFSPPVSLTFSLILSVLTSLLALTLSCCLYRSLYHFFFLSLLPARSSSDWSLTYWEKGDGTEPMLIVCFYLRAAECVWAIDMRTSIKRCAVKVHGLCRLVFGRNNCTLHPNSRLVKQEEGGKKEGQGRVGGEWDKERDRGWR